jgi:uncharacterized SAM-binding protein YcdF (DUF218 family)
MNHTTYEDAMIVWSYMLTESRAGDADCMIVLGSRDDRVATYAAQLAKKYTYQHVLLTGGIAHGHDLLHTSWPEDTEAEHFLAVMRAAGYKNPVLLEKKATNTGENALFSYDLIKRKGIEQPGTVLIVTKPYMERRALATFEAQWPHRDVTFYVSSPLRQFDEYISDDQNYDDVVHIMVGDLQRIMEYPKRGLQSPQVVPSAVKQAWERLIATGYTKHLISK